MLACAGGHEDTVNTLVNENADVLLADKKGKTALLRAAAVAGSEPATRRLLDASANAAACPVEGKTLADLAAKKNPACAKHIARALSPEGAAERLLEAAEKGRVAAVAATPGGRTSSPIQTPSSTTTDGPRCTSPPRREPRSSFDFFSKRASPRTPRRRTAPRPSNSPRRRNTKTRRGFFERASSRRRGRARVVVQSSSDAIRLVSLASSAVYAVYE